MTYVYIIHMYGIDIFAHKIAKNVVEINQIVFLFDITTIFV